MAHKELELPVSLEPGKNFSEGIGTLTQPQTLPFNFILTTRCGCDKDGTVVVEEAN